MLQEATAAESEELSPAGGGVTPVTGVGRSRGTENTENGNPPATLDTHNTSPHPGVPIAIGIGVKLAQENSTKNGNPPATLSPTSYPNPFGSEELSPAPDKFGSGGDPARAGTGVGHSRGTQNTSPHPGDLGVYSRGTENTGLDPVSPHSPLYQTYQYILEKRKLAEEDILHASWYSQQKRAEAEAPPPHILTDEEIAEMNRTLAEERSRTLAQPQYSTFGKIYFPEKDTRCSL